MCDAHSNSRTNTTITIAPVQCLPATGSFILPRSFVNPNAMSAAMSSSKIRPLVMTRACVVFPWFAMRRQVTVEGAVTMLTQEQSEPYYRSRPRGSQLGAWASRQSTVLESRKQLDERAAELERRWPQGSVIPMPDFWRGYLLTPETVEFWQAGQFRLHDRLRYRRAGEQWMIERLSP